MSRKPYTEEELEYLCRFSEIDGVPSIACGLNRSQLSIYKKIQKLKTTGRYEHYRSCHIYY